jgi:hypothetical protein
MLGTEAGPWSITQNRKAEGRSPIGWLMVSWVAPVTAYQWPCALPGSPVAGNAGSDRALAVGRVIALAGAAVVAAALAGTTPRLISPSDKQANADSCAGNGRMPKACLPVRSFAGRHYQLRQIAEEQK